MDDFLHQLRNNGNARRYDRPRKTYDGNQYNNDKRRPSNHNRYNPRYQAESEHLPIIRKTLEEIAANQARQITLGERRAVAEERKAEAMESIAAWLGQQNAPQGFVQEPETVTQTPEPVTEEVQASPEPPAARSYQRSELVEMINGLRKKGLSYEKIALHMQNEKVPTLSGRGQWRGQSVYRLCQV